MAWPVPAVNCPLPCILPIWMCNKSLDSEENFDLDMSMDSSDSDSEPLPWQGKTAWSQRPHKLRVQAQQTGSQSPSQPPQQSHDAQQSPVPTSTSQAICDGNCNCALLTGLELDRDMESHDKNIKVSNIKHFFQKMATGTWSVDRTKCGKAKQEALEAAKKIHNEALESDLISLGRSIVQSLHASGQWQDVFKAYIIEGNQNGYWDTEDANGTPTGKKMQIDVLQLLHDITTHWDSVYYMICHLCYLHQPINTFFEHLNNKDLKKYKLSKMQWKVLQDFELILESWDAPEYKQVKKVVIAMMSKYHKSTRLMEVHPGPIPSAPLKWPTLACGLSYSLNSDDKSSGPEDVNVTLCSIEQELNSYDSCYMEKQSDTLQFWQKSCLSFTYGLLPDEDDLVKDGEDALGMFLATNPECAQESLEGLLKALSEDDHVANGSDPEDSEEGEQAGQAHGMDNLIDTLNDAEGEEVQDESDIRENSSFNIALPIIMPAFESAKQAFLCSEGHHIIDGWFKLLKEIGRGHSSSDIVAKLQDTEHGQTLLYEYHIQKALAGGLGIPCVWWLGVDDSAKVLIIDRLGPSLEDCLSQQSSCCKDWNGRRVGGG
ncbi:hypothetical protein EDC04DRAFT_2607287 [Pisolithus marmoratus]|nr:hypothetical protein EDC04DRAFT_2607287 [Pisolithus marmoratus]